MVSGGEFDFVVKVFSFGWEVNHPSQRDHCICWLCKKEGRFFFRLPAHF